MATAAVRLLCCGGVNASASASSSSTSSLLALTFTSRLDARREIDLTFGVERRRSGACREAAKRQTIAGERGLGRDAHFLAAADDDDVVEGDRANRDDLDRAARLAAGRVCRRAGVALRRES